MPMSERTGRMRDVGGGSRRVFKRGRHSGGQGNTTYLDDSFEIAVQAVDL
jgi:hypothetical protein